MFVRKVCLSYNNIQQSMRKFFMPFLGTAHNHPNFFILFWSTPASSSELCTNSDRLLTIISNLYYSIPIGCKIPLTFTKIQSQIKSLINETTGGTPPLSMTLNYTHQPTKIMQEPTQATSKRKSRGVSRELKSDCILLHMTTQKKF